MNIIIITPRLIRPKDKVRLLALTNNSLSRTKIELYGKMFYNFWLSIFLPKC